MSRRLLKPQNEIPSQGKRWGKAGVGLVASPRGGSVTAFNHFQVDVRWQLRDCPEPPTRSLLDQGRGWRESRIRAQGIKPQRDPHFGELPKECFRATTFQGLFPLYHTLGGSPSKILSRKRRSEMVAGAATQMRGRRSGQSTERTNRGGREGSTKGKWDIRRATCGGRCRECEQKYPACWRRIVNTRQRFRRFRLDKFRDLSISLGIPLESRRI
jgi:hypothetical protein